jgi:hypothetical protein
MEQDEIERIVSAALAALYEQDIRILRLDVAERTICARLAALLQPSFARHQVHADYNRHGIYPKEIELPDAQGALTRNLVSPDIIVHQPGHDEENVLVIEAKKTTNAIPDEADLAKLAQIKSQIGYRFALFIRLSAGPDASAAGTRMIWVR